MQTNNILSAELIDIIFDDRNKMYGAYELRKSYSQRIKKALLITTTCMGLVVGGTLLANSNKSQSGNYRVHTETTIADLAEAKKEIPPPEQPKKQPEVQVKTERFTPPVIKENDEVQNPPPSQDDLDKAQIGIKPVDGIDDPGVANGPKPPDEGKGVVEQKVEKDPDEIVTIVEVDAKFPGNWKAFLERNLDGNVPAENNAPTGRYSVVIQFVVDKEGNVSNIQPLTSHGYGMEEEAVRVLRKATKWEPAIQNGYKVKAYRKQTIIFDVQGDE